MRNRTATPAAILLVCLASAVVAACFAGAESAAVEPPNRLAVVWTSGDPEVASKMVFMYVHNAQKQGWFDENLLIVWGPSSRLLAENEELQGRVKAMIAGGVKLQACQACADMYGVSPKLRELGVEVKYMGEPLSKLLQDDAWDVVTF